jgi:hypothetical protein
MLSREATNTNYIVFGLTRPGCKLMIYHTRGQHANHYATDAGFLKSVYSIKCKTHYKRSDGKDFNNLLGKFFFETGDPQPL